MDDDGSGTLSLAEFKKAMGEMNLPDTGLELKALFEHSDADGSGLVTHEEFLQGVRDPLTPRRLALVRQAFGAIDRDGSCVVEPGEIADRYDASRHPDVLAGTKTADEVYAQFLATFDVGGEVDGKVTAREFENYYTNVGASDRRRRLLRAHDPQRVAHLGRSGATDARDGSGRTVQRGRCVVASAHRASSARTRD